MLFNLLPQQTLKFNLFFFQVCFLLTYCNTKFFMPKLKAEIVLLIPRADTVLYIYRSNKWSLLPDSLSGTHWKIKVSKWISNFCCVSQEKVYTAALCVHQSCMSSHPGDDYATLLLDDISIFCSSSHLPAGSPQRRPVWTATVPNPIQVTKIRLFALLTLVLGQIPSRRRKLNGGAVGVCMQSEEGRRIKRVWCTEMNVLSHRGKQCCCSSHPW